MKNPISISTGLVYRLTEDRNNMIQRLRKYSPEGIELSFAYPKLLIDFTISLENLEYLRTLKFNSVHAPWKDIVYGNNPLAKQVLEKIQDLYNKIGARNVVFHKGIKDDFSILRNFNFNASIENDDWKKGLNTVLQIEQELKQNPNLKFTFDFAHALTVSDNDIKVYLTRFQDRIIQVHLSMLNKELEDHYFLFKYDSLELRDLIKLIPQNIPLILECVASNENEVDLVKEEIMYIKNI
jgi:hypothetical protein